MEESRYTRYERGEVEPDLSILLRICRVLELGPNQLLGYVPRKPTDPSIH
jgi:DNA-binding Xre family transcriptional regulator